MRRSSHSLVGSALSVLCLIGCLLGVSAVLVRGFLLIPVMLTFVTGFGGSSLLCGWGAYSHLRRGLRTVSETGGGLRIPEVVFVLPALVVSLYVVCYLVLSVQGAYEPLTEGTKGVKTHAWYPRGFLRESGRWRSSVITFFSPIWFLDNRLWHDDWTETGDSEARSTPGQIPAENGFLAVEPIFARVREETVYVCLTPSRQSCLTSAIELFPKH